MTIDTTPSLSWAFVVSTAYSRYNAGMTNRVIEHLFFFGILALAAYVTWQIVAPFVGALALAAIVATITHPLHIRILRRVPKQNKTIAAIITTLVVVIVLIIPLSIVGSLLVLEAVSFYSALSGGTFSTFESSVIEIERIAQNIIPNFSLDVAALAQQGAGWVASNVGAIFAGTASTVFLFGIALIALFYFFRDGVEFTRYMVKLSPLPDSDDEHIIARVATSIRRVVLGTLLVALIQGTLTAIGFTIFGFEQAILWGSLAAIGALIPTIGTAIVFIPAMGFLLYSGMFGTFLGLLVWWLVAVAFIDNLLGPYLMSRGSTIHPFLILISVLGGIALFGPVGFVLGPVVMSFLLVLLEMYSLHMPKE